MPVMTQEQREALETDILEGNGGYAELMERYDISHTVVKRYVRKTSPTGKLIFKREGRRDYRAAWQRDTGLTLPTDYMRGAFNVHHADGDHKNNAPENLCLLLADDHTRVHATGEAPWQYQDRAIAVLMEHEADPYDGRQGCL